MSISSRALFTFLPAVLLPATLFAGSITGTVRGPDSTSAGIAGAAVVLTTSAGQGAPRVPVDTTQTDAQGKYAFAALAAAGSYGVTASATGFQTVSVNRLSLDSAETKVVNLTLPLPYPPATISGTVRGPDSTSPVIPNAKVILSKSGGGQGLRTKVDSALTDAQGHFSFANLPSAENYGIDVPAPSASFRDYDDHNVDLRGVNLNLNIILDPPPAPGTITGTVRGPDSTSPPMANAVVVLNKPGATDSVRIPVDTALTDAAGLFTFADIPPLEDYGITVTSPVTGYRVYSRGNLEIDGDTLTLNVRLRALGIFSRAMAARGFHAAWTPQGLALKFPARAGSRILTVFSISGATRFKAGIPAYAGQAFLPENVMVERGLKVIVSGSGSPEVFTPPIR